MSKIVAIWPYHRFSKGYKELNKLLGLPFKRTQDLELHFSGISPKPVDVLINWGSGQIPGWLLPSSKTIINPTGSVNVCGDKLRFFTTMQAATEGPRIPEFTDDLEKAMGWVEEGKTVLGRMRRGSCGQDIVFYEDDPERFQASEWWGVYKKKMHEFRIHVFGGEVISEQQKAVRTTNVDGSPIPPDSIDYRIRNHRNGFIFKRNDISIPEDVRVQALRAVASVPKLTFGAVDVIWNKYENKAYVLEVNTAPGLEGTTLEDYANAFKQYL